MIDDAIFINAPNFDSKEACTKGNKTSADQSFVLYDNMVSSRDEPILLFSHPFFFWQFFYFQPIFLSILLEIYGFTQR